MLENNMAVIGYNYSWLVQAFVFLFLKCETLSAINDTNSFECQYTIEGDGEDIVGQFAIFSCADKNETNVDNSESFNQSSVAWYRLESSGTPQLVQFDQWFMTKNDNGVDFVCALESGEDELETVCHVTPLKILPTVIVKRSLIAAEGTAMFVCIAEGIPSIAEYNWYIDDVHIEKYRSELSTPGEATESDRLEVELHSNTVMELIGVTSKHRGLAVTCEGVTSTGLSASANMAIQIKPEKSNSGGLTSDKIFLFGCIFAGGVPIIFAVVAGACWVVRHDKDDIEKRTTTLEEEDLSPAVVANGDSLPRSITSGVTSDMPANAVLYRTHSVRSTKDKVGPMSQLVLPPIGMEPNRVSQHIYDEAPHFATSELALSKGKHSSTLPAKTYTSRSSLYRMSADYADVPLQVYQGIPAAGNYENFRVQSIGDRPSANHHRFPNATLPVMRT